MERLPSIMVVWENLTVSSPLVKHADLSKTHRLKGYHMFSFCLNRTKSRHATTSAGHMQRGDTKAYPATTIGIHTSVLEVDQKQISGEQLDSLSSGADGIG